MSNCSSLPGKLRDLTFSSLTLLTMYIRAVWNVFKLYIFFKILSLYIYLAKFYLKKYFTMKLSYFTIKPNFKDTIKDVWEYGSCFVSVHSEFNVSFSSFEHLN